MQQKKLLIITFLCIAISACGDDRNTNQSQTEKVNEEAMVSQKDNQSLDSLYLQAKTVLFKQRQISATVYGLSESELGYYQDQIEDYSVQSEQNLREQLLSLSQKIEAWPNDSLSADEIENKQVMASITRYYAGHSEFGIGYIDTWMGLSPFVVNQINGPLIDIPKVLQNAHKIETEQDALDYISRLAKFDQLLASITQKLEADVAKGWIAPKVILQGAVNFMNGFVAAKPEDHFLIRSLATKLQDTNLSQLKQKALINQAKAKLVEVVYPAYQALSEKTNSLVDKARDESGIWAQPNGVAYYQDAILQLGDSQLTADQIHQIGLDEVKRITTQMDVILTKEGYTEGSVGLRMIKLLDEPRFLYADSDEGRKELLADLNRYIEEITAKMPPLFKTKPPYQVEVKAFPKAVEEGSPGGQYTSPSLDGTQPGVYWINLRDMKANPKFGLKTLTYHEANPGHHWQVALNLAQDSLPFLRRIAPYNAYVEGWALYSELVAFEMGMYKDDPFGNLGRLQGELFRAVRLVVDTGLHYKKWTREEAIKYMAETTGTAESDVVVEIERYMAWPGQALGYKLGMIKIIALRQSAEKQLGEKFDLAEFHDLVLLGGAVPMLVLEKKINQWISSK